MAWAKGDGLVAAGVVAAMRAHVRVGSSAPSMEYVCASSGGSVISLGRRRDCTLVCAKAMLAETEWRIRGPRSTLAETDLESTWSEIDAGGG